MFTRSSRHYRGIMTSFYSICIVLGTVCGNPLSAVSEFNISGHVGSTAVLPCKLESEDTGTLYIKWQIESEIVFERHGEETYQGEGYEGRVDVPEEELRKGNCSLVLNNLKPTDAAVYRSSQRVRRTKRSVETKTVALSRVDLSVDENLNKENNAENEVPRDGGRTGVGVGVGVGVVGTIAVIAVIVAVLYRYKRRRNRSVDSEEDAAGYNPVKTSPE